MIARIAGLSHREGMNGIIYTYVYIYIMDIKEASGC